MRQAGIVAAGALWALDHNVERLAEDHANARALAEALAAIDGVEIEPDDGGDEHRLSSRSPTPTGWSAELEAEGIEMSVLEGRIRAVTHLDVDRAGVERAADAVARLLPRAL